MYRISQLFKSSISSDELARRRKSFASMRPSAFSSNDKVRSSGRSERAGITDDKLIKWLLERRRVCRDDKPRREPGCRDLNSLKDTLKLTSDESPSNVPCVMLSILLPSSCNQKLKITNSSLINQITIVRNQNNVKSSFIHPV